MSYSNKSNINHIRKVQRKAIHIITHSNHNDHTGPLFKNLGILPFDNIIEQSKLTLMNIIEFNYAQWAFENTWIKTTNIAWAMHFMMKKTIYYLIEFF